MAIILPIAMTAGGGGHTPLRSSAKGRTPVRMARSVNATSPALLNTKRAAVALRYHPAEGAPVVFKVKIEHK